jgi:hypothetical protein
MTEQQVGYARRGGCASVAWSILLLVTASSGAWADDAGAYLRLDRELVERAMAAARERERYRTQAGDLPPAEARRLDRELRAQREAQRRLFQRQRDRVRRGRPGPSPVAPSPRVAPAWQAQRLRLERRTQSLGQRLQRRTWPYGR